LSDPLYFDDLSDRSLVELAARLAAELREIEDRIWNDRFMTKLGACSSRWSNCRSIRFVPSPGLQWPATLGVSLIVTIVSVGVYRLGWRRLWQGCSQGNQRSAPGR